MLTMNGKPIITEQDFCDYFNREELLAQKEEFWVFAKNNWSFIAPSILARHCYGVYQKATKNAYEMSDMKIGITWQYFLKLPPEPEAEGKRSKEETKRAKEEIQKIISTAVSTLPRWASRWLDELCTSTYRDKTKFNWQSALWADVSVLILAFYHMKRLGITERPTEQKKQETEEDTSRLLRLTGDKTELIVMSDKGILRKNHTCRYDPTFVLKTGDCIRSHPIVAQGEDVILEFVSIIDESHVLWKRSLKKDEVVWVNMVGDLVVSVIENQVLRSTDQLEKLTKEGAYSVVEVAPDLFVYLQEGKLKHSAATSAISEDWRAYPGKFVEVAFVNGRLHVLTDQGRVYAKNMRYSEKIVALNRLGGKNGNKV